MERQEAENFPPDLDSPREADRPQDVPLRQLKQGENPRFPKWSEAELYPPGTPPFDYLRQMILLPFINEYDITPTVEALQAEHETIGQKNVIVVSGKLGSGKTTTAHNVQQLYAQKDLPITVVTAEDAITAGKYMEDVYGDPLVNPEKTSGPYSEVEYRNSSHILRKAIFASLADHDTVLVEAPVVTRLEKTTLQPIHDRGTSAVRDLFQRRGDFDSVDYSVFFLGLVPTPRLIRLAKAERKLLDQQSDPTLPGGSYKSTQFADGELKKFARESSIRGRIAREKPENSSVSDVSTSNYYLPRVLMEYYKGLFEDYFLIDTSTKDQIGIYLNDLQPHTRVSEEERKKTAEDMRRGSYIRQLMEQGELDLINPYLV